MFELMIHKASQNLAVNFTLLGLNQLKKEFVLGHMNFRTLLLKKLRPSDLQTYLPFFYRTVVKLETLAQIK